MSLEFTVRIFKGDKYYIARVPELGVTTKERTGKEAESNFQRSSSASS
jgi:hypothetical protein